LLTVLTTGVFDILHPGHIFLLRSINEQYSSCRLIVGVNDDKRAGELKPQMVFSAEERAEILRACRFVDKVVIFEDDTPEHLIRLIRPDIFVKGGDYKASELPEQQACDDVGATIIIISQFTDGSGVAYSSSRIKRGLDV